jgi:hypothetical protein
MQLGRLHLTQAELALVMVALAVAAVAVLQDLEVARYLHHFLDSNLLPEALVLKEGMAVKAKVHRVVLRSQHSHKAAVAEAEAVPVLQEEPD